MPSTDDLHDAGARAAGQPVPLPSIDGLSAEVSRRRNRRRTLIGSSIAGVVLLAAVPFAAAQLGDDEVPSLLTSAQDGEAPDTTIEAPTTTAAAPAEGTDDTDADPDGHHDDEHDNDHDGLDGMDRHHDFDLDFTLDDNFSFAIRGVGGDEAAAAAADAEARADETRTIDELTVWIDRNGDTTTVSSLVEPTQFVEVTGPSDSIESLLDMITNNGAMFGFGGDFDFGSEFDITPFEDFLTPEMREEFERMRDQFGTFEFGEPGELPDFESLPDFENLPNLDEFLTPELREQLENGDVWELFNDGEFNQFFDGPLFDEDFFHQEEPQDTSTSA
jgi:hypothetical protein